MKKLKKIQFDDSTISLLKDKSIKIDIYEYHTNNMKIESDEDFEKLKEFYEQNYFNENLSFNNVYLYVSKKLEKNGYDAITPDKAFDFLVKNYNDIPNNKQKYLKYFIVLCQDDMAFKRFFIFEKINGFQILNLYKDIFSQYCSTNVLYDFLRLSKNKQEIEERKKIIIDHIQKNSNLFHNERGYFSILYNNRMKKIGGN